MKGKKKYRTLLLALAIVHVQWRKYQVRNALIFNLKHRRKEEYEEKKILIELLVVATKRRRDEKRR